MGKKRIIQKSEADTLREKAELEALAKGTVKSTSRTALAGRAYIRATYNNTIITFTDDKGNVMVTSSAGALGFKGPKKATPFAAAKVVEFLAQKTQKGGLRELQVFVKGIGAGRESAIRALATNGFDLLSIKDTTPIPHNGPKLKKPRRV